MTRRKAARRGAFLLALLALVTAPAPGTGAQDADRPSILLITIDTLRADHLGCYGYRLPTTPHLDALAARGVRFADCTVQWPKTWPSLASLLSGAHPRTTGIRYVRRVLPPEMVMLSEILGEAGYVTAAVVANYNVGRTFGFQQGFDVFIESWHERWREQMGDAYFENRAGRTKRFTDAGLVTDQALRLLDRRSAGRPFFLWLHYMDPHGPYVPPEGYAELFADAHPAEPVPLDVIPNYQRQSDPVSGERITDLGFYKAQYDREIRYLDDELGRLLEGLERRGLRKGTLLVVTADHGESQGEHEYYLEHGKFSYQVNAHVPLFLVQEGRIPAGGVIEAPVGLIDLTPTLLALAGLPPADTHEGQNLLPLILDEPGAAAPDYVFMESGYHPQEPQLTVRHGDWKLIHVQSAEDRAEMDGGAWELYDLAADPGETLNLAGERPELVEWLGMLLVDWYTGTPPPPPGEEVDLDTLDARDREMLRSLGY